VETKDSEKIHVWFLPQPQQSTAPTLIFFHGNAGNIGFRLPNAKTLYHYTKVNILMVEYRGYGNSTGSPSETGLLMDADAALRFLREDTKVDQKQIFVFGRSLGGAVAITLCYHRQKFLRGLIVENTFTGIDEMAVLILARLGVRRGHTLAKAFLYFFLTNRWPNLDLIRKIKIPILFISGLADELIPPSHMQRLHDAATESVGKRFYGVPNGEHNDTYIQGAATYYMQLSSFIQSILANTVNDHNVPAVN
jgi:fermentation-respiration switch protein FrsA (DUF1100 family)